MPLDAEFQNQYAGYHPGMILSYQFSAKVQTFAYDQSEWFLF